MDWKTYRQAYFDFDVAVCEAQIIANSCYHVMVDFPNRLDSSYSSSINAAIDRMLDIAEAEVAAGKKESYDFGSIIESIEPLVGKEVAFVLRPLIDAYQSRSLTKQPLDVPRIEKLFSQQLIMSFAQLDSFLAQTFRVIAMAEPRVLRSNRKMSWEEILKIGSWDSLVKHIRELYVYEMGWLPVLERVEKMSATHGLAIEFSGVVSEVVEAGEKLRHKFIHDGGRIDADLAAHLEIATEEIDEVYVVSQSEAEGIALAVRAVGGVVFKAVSEKFFGNEDLSFSGVTYDAGKE